MYVVKKACGRVQAGSILSGSLQIDGYLQVSSLWFQTAQQIENSPGPRRNTVSPKKTECKRVYCGLLCARSHVLPLSGISMVSCNLDSYHPNRILVDLYPHFFTSGTKTDTWIMKIQWLELSPSLQWHQSRLKSHTEMPTLLNTLLQNGKAL
jgi:hypothetical protein